MPATTMTTKKNKNDRPSSSSRTLALTKAAMDSVRNMNLESTRMLDVAPADMMNAQEQGDYDRLLQCIQAHKLQRNSNQQLYEIKRFIHVSKRTSLHENHGKICIACTRPECFHKVFLAEPTHPSTESDSIEAWKLEQTRIMTDLMEHETKHYVTLAKIFLWILEALMTLIVNYYEV